MTTPSTYTTNRDATPVRAGRAFATSRKLGKTHQQVLVFCKGDPVRATAACGECEFGEIAPDEAGAGGLAEAVLDDEIAA